MEFRDLRKQYKVLKDDINREIADVCNNATFIGGEPVKKLEQELADYVGVKHCISCANGTDALQLALMAWGIGAGDIVFVPDFTYFSSGEVVSAVGAVPIFVDIDPVTFNLDPEALRNAVECCREEPDYNGLKAKAVIAVDLFGLPADYDRIRPICEEYDLLLLEDGAQGFGGIVRQRDGTEKRACSFGDIGTTSFFPAKPLGCYGDGGAVFTDSDEWASLIRSYAVHGKGASKYDNIRIGMNSRLDTIQAAILSVKFEAFKRYELSDVNKVADYYTSNLQDTKLRLPVIPQGMFSSWAQYTVVIPEDVDRDDVITELKENGIPAMVYYQKPMHRQKAFAGTISAEADCPVAEDICRRCLSLPIDPYKTEKEIDEVKKVLFCLI